MPEGVQAAAVSVAWPTLSHFVVLHIRDLDSAGERALSSAFDVAWPVAPNTGAGEDLTVLWLSPIEWAVVGMSPVEVTDRASRALAARLHHVTDVTDGSIMVRLDGPRSRDLLAKGCSLDLHPRSFRPHNCARTLLAQLPVIIHRPDETDRFDLFVDATYRDYLSRWFDVASAGL